jgi:FtsP/CotA-like multicopper oxidase with cupredoxin domain
MRARMNRMLGLSSGLAAVALLLVAIPALAQSLGGDGGSASSATARQRTAKKPVARTTAKALTAPARAAAKPVAPVRRSQPRAAAPQRVRKLQVLATPIELCAKAGTKLMPDGSTVNIWGFVQKPAALPCSDSSVVPDLPGPVLEATVGDTVTVTLYNELSENVSMVFTGQGAAPDESGAPPGGSKVYSFSAANPGTYLYESGTNTSRQVPMGLYGAMIVRPTTAGRAYGPSTTYDVESVVVLSEIDPALNAAPNSFDLLDYAPEFWLINGKGYPNTAAIGASVGNKLLLRYVNAGLQNHTMTLVGAHQSVIAKDAFAEPYPFAVVAETLPSGSTADMIATIPAGSAGAAFPLYSRQLHVTNGAAFPGGMLTFVNVAP